MTESKEFSVCRSTLTGTHNIQNNELSNTISYSGTDIHAGLDRTTILLSLDEDVCINGVEHKLTDELLCDRDGCFIGHAQVWKVIQKPEEKA